MEQGCFGGVARRCWIDVWEQVELMHLGGYRVRGDYFHCKCVGSQDVIPYRDGGKSLLLLISSQSPA